MKRIYYEDRKYGEEKRIRNAKRHRAGVRDRKAEYRAHKRGERQEMQREIKDGY